MRACLASVAALGTVVVVFAALTVAAAFSWRELFQPDSQHDRLAFVVVLTGIAVVSFIAGSAVGNRLSRNGNESASTQEGNWTTCPRSVQIGEPGPIWLLRERGFGLEVERHD
jgi:hypothetical protein